MYINVNRLPLKIIPPRLNHIFFIFINFYFIFFQIELQGPSKTFYEGESYRLQFKFNMKYPFDSPQVVFAGNLIPVHPHIYSNGNICLSILTEDWSPALSVQSVCLSIISMLSSAKEKVRPVDDSFYVKTCSKNPKKTPWHYHDDSI